MTRPVFQIANIEEDDKIVSFVIIFFVI